MAKLLVELDWARVKEAELESLSMTEIGMMLRDSAWRKIKWKWEVETLEPSKLGVNTRTIEARSDAKAAGSWE